MHLVYFMLVEKIKLTRSPKEIAKLFDLKDTELNKGAKNFMRIKKIQSKVLDMGTSKPMDFIKRKCDKLGLKTLYTDKAIQIANNIDKLNLASKHTSYSLAAASILLMTEICNISSVSKKQLAIIFDVSDVTISKTYKKVHILKDKILDNVAIDKFIEKKNSKTYLPNNKILVSKQTYDRMKRFNIETNNYVYLDESINTVVEESFINIDIKDFSSFLFASKITSKTFPVILSNLHFKLNNAVNYDIEIKNIFIEVLTK